jgi:tellurite resistance protein
MGIVDSPRRILELMFLTAWADGRFEGSEALAIHKLTAQEPLLREAGHAPDVDRVVKRQLAERGLDACVREAAAAITHPAQRELAFRSCAKVSGADGAFGEQEGKVLRILRETWNLSADDVERLLVLATRP